MQTGLSGSSHSWHEVRFCEGRGPNCYDVPLKIWGISHEKVNSSCDMPFFDDCFPRQEGHAGVVPASAAATGEKRYFRICGRYTAA